MVSAVAVANHRPVTRGSVPMVMARPQAVLTEAREYQRLSTVGQFVLLALYRKGEVQVFEAPPGGSGGDAVDELLLAVRHRGQLLARDSREVLVRLLVEEYAPAGLASVDRKAERFERVELHPTTADRARMERRAELAALDDEARAERRRSNGRTRINRFRSKEGGRGSGMERNAAPPSSCNADPPGSPPRQPPPDVTLSAALEGREEEEDLRSSSSSSSPGNTGRTVADTTGATPLPPPPCNAPVCNAPQSVTPPPGGGSPRLTWSEVAGVLGGGSNRRIGVRGTPEPARQRFLDVLVGFEATREHMVEMARLASQGKLRDQDKRHVTDVALLASNATLLGSWFNAADAAIEARRAEAAKQRAQRQRDLTPKPPPPPTQGSLGLPANATEPTSNAVPPVAPATPALAQRLGALSSLVQPGVARSMPAAPPAAAVGEDKPP